MAGNNLVFYGTTGSSGVADGNSQPDPSQWLGNYRASQRLDEIESTITANQTTNGRHVFVDSNRVGDGVQAHALKWIAFQTGVMAPSAARVVSFDDATGTFVLDRRLEGGTGASTGDVYRIFAKNNVWPDVTAAQALAGDERFRCIAVRNEHGTILNSFQRRVIFRPLSLGSLDFALIAQTFSIGSPFLLREDDETDVVNETGYPDPLGGPNRFERTSTWVNPFAIATAYTDIGDTASWTLNQHAAIWLRRRIPALSRLRRSVAVQVMVATDVTTSDPNPLSGSAVMAYDIVGGALTGSISRDRYTHVGGGGRMTGQILADGVAAPSRYARWFLRQGDFGSLFTDDDPVVDFDTSDAEGQVQSTFVSPEAEAQEGETTEIRLSIGAGEEVANPQPRLVLQGTAQMAWDVSGEITIPSDEQSFLGDQATGFWPGF